MSALHALLIGIDQYIPPSRGGGICYPPLTGAVRDIRRVREFLLGLPAPPVRLLELTASSGVGPEPIEPHGQWPTYATMVDKFRELAAGADEGDQVYIHYSGHGGRTPTLFEKERGSNQYDESLVPCTISDPNEQYLRDVEVAKLIEEMVDKGLFVTVVLDCCHSGGVRRNLKHPIPRGLPVPDGTGRPLASRVGTRDELAVFLRPREVTPLPGRTLRHGLFGGWLAEPKGYVQLAACRPQETAFEYPLAGGETQGALTYRLLEALREGGTKATWREIYDLVYNRVHDQFQKQAPLLLGEKGRTFLGVDPIDPPAPISEIKVLGGESDWLLLGAGRAQGISEGMRFAIYPPTLHGGMGGRRTAVVEVIKVGATECRARVVEAFSREPAGGGSLAIPLDGVAIQRPAVCALVSYECPPGSDQERALERVRRTLKHDSSGALKRAEPGEPVDFQVAVNERGEYEISGKEGSPLLNLGPPLSIAAAGAENELLRRLIHLAKFSDLERNDNTTARAPLNGKIGLEVCGVELKGGAGKEPELRPLADTTGPIELRCGEALVLEIENRSSKALNIVVLDLQPDWGITQIFPLKRDAEFWPLDPKEKRTVRISAWLPEECEESKDVIKIFATVGIPSFLWCELPPLYRSEPATRVMRGLQATGNEPLEASHLTFNEFASQEWTTAQIEMLVRR